MEKQAMDRKKYFSPPVWATRPDGRGLDGKPDEQKSNKNPPYLCAGLG
jgi:hypothetical protein